MCARRSRRRLCRRLRRACATLLLPAAFSIDFLHAILGSLGVPSHLGMLISVVTVVCLFLSCLPPFALLRGPWSVDPAAAAAAAADDFVANSSATSFKMRVSLEFDALSAIINLGKGLALTGASSGILLAKCCLVALVNPIPVLLLLIIYAIWASWLNWALWDMPALPWAVLLSFLVLSKTLKSSKVTPGGCSESPGLRSSSVANVQRQIRDSQRQLRELGGCWKKACGRLASADTNECLRIQHLHMYLCVRCKSITRHV